jgi:hypothetical protein
MITIKNVDTSVTDNLNVTVSPNGWIVMVEEKGEQRPFKVTSMIFRFDLNDDEIIYFPTNRSFSIRGHVAKKDGRGWFTKEEWIWSHRQINGKALEFPDLPQIIQDSVYKSVVDLVSTQQSKLANSLEGLTKNRRFIPPGYQSMHNKTPTINALINQITGEEDEEEDTGLPFLPSVAVTAAKIAWEEQDVSKWKVAAKEINHVPEPESNEETQVSA